MLPILIMQVILIPVATGWMMDVWALRRRENELRDIGGQLGTTIQQLYYSLNREEIVAGITTQTPQVPSSIEFIPYNVTASGQKYEDSTIIDLKLILKGTSTEASTRVTLGPNVIWQESIFVSNSTDAHISVEKFSNGTLSFSFG
jgi:hypothetical protein